MGSIIIAYSNLYTLRKEKQPKNKTENQDAKVTNWPLLVRFQISPSWEMLKITISLLSLGKSSCSAQIPELCRAQQPHLAQDLILVCNPTFGPRGAKNAIQSFKDNGLPLL